MNEKHLFGLCMIVKNEEHVIERAMRSALRMMDTFCIVDTGSTDKTKEIIQKVSNELGIKGFVYDRPWVNFGHNRSEALELARVHMKWAFMLDADDILEGEIIDKSLLKDDIGGYYINTVQNNIIFKLLFMFNFKYNWKFVGVTHEYSDCFDSSAKIAYLPDSVFMKYSCEGNRNISKQKFINDIELLEKDLLNPLSKGRTLFYLAQSYRDIGNKEKAIQYYLERANFGGWIEEVYESYNNLIKLSDSIDDKLKYSWKAQNCIPDRKEAVYDILEYARKNNKYTQEIYALGLVFKDNQLDTKHLFSDTYKYGWSYDDEFGLNAFYTNHFDIAYKAFNKALKTCPDNDKGRIEKNIFYSLKNINSTLNTKINTDRIPKIIHQIWIGHKTIPSKSLEYIQKIIELHPTFQYKLWTNDDLIKENFTNYDIINNCNSWAQKSDIMRYEILYKYGGVYLDIDFEIFKNLEPLLNNDLIVCNEDHQINIIMTNAFIASNINNKYMLNCINNVKTIDFTQSINVATGPHYLRKCINLNDTNVTILPTHTMYPTHWTMKSYYPYNYLEATYGVHHWNADW